MKKIIIIGIFIALLIYMLYLNYQYNKFYKNVSENVNLEAVVVSNVKKGNYYNIYTVRGKNGIFKNKKIILYTKENVEFGDKIKISGDFIEPQTQRNYKGFNYKKYLQTQGVYGSIKSKDVIVISKNNVNTVLILSNKLRNRIIKNIKEILPADTSGLLIGILLGDRTNLDEEINNNFQKSSLAHILAVSGTHVSYIVIGTAIFIKLNKLSKKRGYILTILVLIFFMFLTNFSLSVIRASIMAIIFIISKLMYRKTNIISTLIISLIVILFINPFSIRSVSLQLSYLGAIGVIYLTPIIQELIQKLKISKKISKIISIPISAQISILPIMVINFNTISLTFLISNILAIPLLGIAIILGFINVFVSFIWMCGAIKLGTIINLILKTIILIAKVCGNLKLSNIYVSTPRTTTILIYYLILIISIYIFNLKKHIKYKPYEIKILSLFSKISIKKIIIIILIIIYLIEFPYTQFNGKLKIYFIDVGQRR